MLNRRHLRVKVLQALYAFHQSDKTDKKGYEKQLMSQVLKVHEIYFYLLALLYQVIDFAESDSAERESRHIKRPDMIGSNEKVSQNQFIEKLRKDLNLKKWIKKLGISFEDNPENTEMIRSLFREFRKSPEFEAYIQVPEVNFEMDRELIQFLFKKIMTKNVALEQYLEERDINWSVDKEIIEGMVNKTIKSVDAHQEISYLELTSNWKEDEQFIHDLFRLTIENDPLFESFIAEKTKNWEMDRIAIMDTILMKMAICEFLNFSSIPVKVTINEYIDISKEFSTPKSKVFINGILDKILIEFKAENKVIKTGRGLVD
jgi:N utilization substance protein B